MTDVSSLQDRGFTIICDIDGTILRHQGTLSAIAINNAEILDGVAAKFNEWTYNGYRIFLITGRTESMRAVTERQLASLGITYDQLIMGASGARRILINDKKPSGELTAAAVNLPRDEGLININLNEAFNDSKRT